MTAVDVAGRAPAAKFSPAAERALDALATHEYFTTGYVADAAILADLPRNPDAVGHLWINHAGELLRGHEPRWDELPRVMSRLTRPHLAHSYPKRPAPSWFLLAGGAEPCHKFVNHGYECGYEAPGWHGPCQLPENYPIHHPDQQYSWLNMWWLTEEFGWELACYYLAGGR